MLTLFGPRQKYCDGVPRRDFLRVGGLGLAGLGLGDLLKLRASANGSRRPKSVIMICLPGGPSHLDTYDMKPRAPEEVRGEFRPIATNLPGLDICEHLPLQATIADKFAVVRSLQFQQPDHQLHEVYTGYPLVARRPAFGSVVSRLWPGPPSILPRYMSLSLSYHPRTVAKAETPSYLGLAHAPFEPTGEGIKNLELAADVSHARMNNRRGLLDTLDHVERQLERSADVASVDTFKAQAFDLIGSAKVRAAFDIEREPRSVRELYGPDIAMKHNYQFGGTWHASHFLLARRLVQAGVPVVTIGMGGWDHHGNVSGVKGTIFERSREQLPAYDRSIHALLTDLQQQGMTDDVAVVVWGEFGRTPGINKYGGRDHYLRAGFALFAGGGLRTGQVIGATDSQAKGPTTRPYRPQNVHATLYHVLGIDPSQTLADSSGRPLAILDDHEPIRELI
jgi:hypothetical protein